MKSTLILIGCIAYSALAVSTSIKDKLSESKKTLAQQTAATCSCTVPPGVGGILPNLGQAVLTGSSQGAQVSQGETLRSNTDSEYAENCEQAACSCHSATHSAQASATRIRTYSVNGTVDALENDIFAESGTAASSANGQRHHVQQTIVNNQGSTSSGAVGSCVSICATNSTA